MTASPTAAVSREAMLEAAMHLPASPQVLAEVNELLLDPHLQLNDIAVVLRRDAALASTVVRIANSPVYPGERVGSIEDAIARLGLAEVFRATGLATTARLQAFALPAYGVPVGAIGPAALLHALAFESLAPFVRVDPLVAYTTGLLRSLGLMVVDHLVRAQCPAPTPVRQAAGRREAELRWIGATSEQVGATVLEQWHFSPEVVAAVRQQYLPAGAAAGPRLAVALNVAGSLVAGLGGALQAEENEWERTAAKLERLGVSEEQIQFAQERTAREFERQRVALQ